MENLNLQYMDCENDYTPAFDCCKLNEQFRNLSAIDYNDMLSMNFRLAKHFETKNKKILKCPYCGKTLGTVDKEVKVELRCFSRKSDKVEYQTIPCRVCHKNVGIAYTTL